MAVSVDPLDALDNPEIKAPEYFGQIQLHTWFCVLEKGVGKVDFDPQKHALDARRTAVKIGLLPLPEHKTNQDIYRDMIAESREWASLVLPNIKALGITARELDGKWVKIGFQPTGRTYTKTDPLSGETVTRDATTFKFIQLFPNEGACRAAYEAERGGSNGGEPPFDGSTSTAPVNGTNGGNRERETALKFLTPLIAKSGGDEAKLAELIASMPMLSKHLSIQSPEVRERLMQYQFDQLQKAA